MNYLEIKKVAREKKVSVTDLIVLSPQNDPFYCGTKTDEAWAKWFHDLWQRFGYNTKVHIRRVHYQIVSQKGLILTPNGLPYENTDKCWHDLLEASKGARYLGLIDPLQLEDRRNPAPAIFAEFSREDGRIELIDNRFDAEMILPFFPGLPNYELSGFIGEQNYFLEIWCEKSTQNDILLPICRQYGANLVTGLGELSATAVAQLVDRIAMASKPTRILYVSDFDPAGLQMPISVARKIEFFLQDKNFDVKLIPVALTKEQTIKYELPRTPIKDSERRKEKFENHYGEGATELDALEALRPGELRRILIEHITKFYDTDLGNNVLEAKWGLLNDLEATREEVLKRYEPQIEELRREYGELNEQIKGLIAGFVDRGENLWQAIKNDLWQAVPDIEAYPIPEPKDGNEFEEPLFDSNRDYFQQLEAYKKHKQN